MGDSRYSPKHCTSVFHCTDSSYTTLCLHVSTHPHIQAGGHRLVLQQTMTLVERAMSLAPLNSVYITEVLPCCLSDLRSVLYLY